MKKYLKELSKKVLYAGMGGLAAIIIRCDPPCDCDSNCQTIPDCTVYDDCSNNSDLDAGSNVDIYDIINPDETTHGDFGVNKDAHGSEDMDLDVSDVDSEVSYDGCLDAVDDRDGKVNKYDGDLTGDVDSNEGVCDSNDAIPDIVDSGDGSLDSLIADQACDRNDGEMDQGYDSASVDGTDTNDDVIPGNDYGDKVDQAQDSGVDTDLNVGQDSYVPGDVIPEEEVSSDTGLDGIGYDGGLDGTSDTGLDFANFDGGDYAEVEVDQEYDGGFDIGVEISLDDTDASSDIGLDISIHFDSSEEADGGEVDQGYDSSPEADSDEIDQVYDEEVDLVYDSGIDGSLDSKDVENTPPIINSALASDYTPAPGFDCVSIVNLDMFDADGDDVDVEYEWKEEGETVSTEETYCPTEEGENIEAVLIACDGEDCSEPYLVSDIVSQTAQDDIIEVVYDAWTTENDSCAINSTSDFLHVHTENFPNRGIIKYENPGVVDSYVLEALVDLYTWAQLVPIGTQSTLEVRKIIEDWEMEAMSCTGCACPPSLPATEEQPFYETSIVVTENNEVAATMVLPESLLQEWSNGENYGVELRVVIKNPGDSEGNYVVYSSESSVTEFHPVLEIKKYDK